METVNFNDCTLDWLDNRFGLFPRERLASLDQWVATTYPLIPDDLRIVRRLARMLFVNAAHWNEQELSLHFIGPMLSLVEFTEIQRFNIFAQHHLQAQVNEHLILTGRVDEMIATGYRSPKIPFFAFNEYKRQTDPNGDPAGQVLAAMLVGQALNNNPLLPMYGCCVIGTLWSFVVLIGKSYAVSKFFDGGDYDDACQILRILFQLKQYCMERTEAPVL